MEYVVSFCIVEEINKRGKEVLPIVCVKEKRVMLIKNEDSFKQEGKLRNFRVIGFLFNKTASKIEVLFLLHNFCKYLPILDHPKV